VGCGFDTLQKRTCDVKRAWSRSSSGDSQNTDEFGNFRTSTFACPNFRDGSTSHVRRRVLEALRPVQSSCANRSVQKAHLLFQNTCSENVRETTKKSHWSMSGHGPFTCLRQSYLPLSLDESIRLPFVEKKVVKQMIRSRSCPPVPPTCEL
jgi:hypothetical protein